MKILSINVDTEDGVEFCQVGRGGSEVTEIKPIIAFGRDWFEVKFLPDSRFVTNDNCSRLVSVDSVTDVEVEYGC